jgi:Fur family transcriptional regulator, ferric uptake regulator
MGSRAGATSPGGPAPEWQVQLRARGYRLTPQRQLVLQAVGELGHATPDEIVTTVRRTATAVNISTVYRTLELLEELGLVQHAHLRHGASTYSLASDADHVHLVCRECGAVEEASTTLVADAVERLGREKGFTVDVGHFSLFGRCAGCGNTAPAEPA